MNILTVIGARPQFVKAAVLSREFSKHKNIKETIVHTGQHYDANMSDIFFEEMDIPKPDYFLNINGSSHGEMTGTMIIEIEKILISLKPDAVLVYGDTNSTLAGAIAAKKLHIKVIHVEAGVRNYNNFMPEEINRLLVDRISDFNFCCTSLGIENLEAEGYFSNRIESKVVFSGDPMYDAALYYYPKSKESTIIQQLGLSDKEFILCTLHRASNTDSKEALTAIVNALNKISKNTRIILPIHPRTSSRMKSFNLQLDFETIEPIGYFDMLQLIVESKEIITDSGGLVREAYFFGKPSLLLLEKPLWPELVSANYCLNASPNTLEIMSQYEALKDIIVDINTKIFGNGKSAEKIVKTLIESL